MEEESKNFKLRTAYNRLNLYQQHDCFELRSEDGGMHWLVERLQDEPYDGKAGDKVVLGWRTEDSILVDE